MACVSELNLDHPLLERPSPAYTHATVRRAFIVWLRCGQRNNFRDVCDYYHRLEAMEDLLPAASRASSRHHEFSLFVSDPPTSSYQQELFPQLYSPQPETLHYSQTIKNYYQKALDISKTERSVTHQEIFDASQVFKSTETVNAGEQTRNDLYSAFKCEHAFKLQKSDTAATNPISVFKITDNNSTMDHTIQLALTHKSLSDSFQNHKQLDKDYNGTTKQEIVETSQMIRNYCKEQQIPLKNFLESFKEYASRCELHNTVNNVGLYIKRKMIYEELKLAVKVFRAKSNFAVNERRLERQEALRVVVTERTNVKDDDQRVSMNNDIKLNSALINHGKTDARTDSQTNNDIKPTRSITKGNLLMTDNVDNNQLGLNEKCIKLLKRDNTETKIPNVDFTSKHYCKQDILKCRKI